MKVSTDKTNEANKTEETKLQDKINEEKMKEYLANGGVEFNDVLMNLGNNGKMFYGVNSLGLSSSVLSSMKPDFIYDMMSMNQDDANFFINMVSGGQFSLSMNETNFNNFNISDIDIAPSTEVQKSIEVSKTLVNLIEKSMQTQKPVRIDFDNNIAVIMKITKDGKISADFIPSNQEVERYLRNNIPLLVQRFEEQNLPYKELTYRHTKQNKQNNKGE
ncbi:flagellar hook-length control protein FliK [bacterium]|nr:flagellar hook-length control protein FliK [bacterium]